MCDKKLEFIYKCFNTEYTHFDSKVINISRAHRF